MRPESVNIFGKEYAVIYCDTEAEADCTGRTCLWGQINYYTRTIRVFAGDRTQEDIWHTLLHEVLHGIVDALHMQGVTLGDDNAIDVLALGLADTLTRNGWARWA